MLDNALITGNGEYNEYNIVSNFIEFIIQKAIHTGIQVIVMLFRVL